MIIYSEIKKISLTEKYQREIFGLGEIYEIMSVEQLRKRLWKKYGNGILFLASNKQHNKRGVNLNELKKHLQEQNLEIIKAGYVDSPPWASAPLSESTKKDYRKIIKIFAQIIFWFLIKVEFFWQRPLKSHMIYSMTKNK